MPANPLPPPSDSANREILSTRVFGASRERVFAAFSEPTQLKRWWGPDGFAGTIEVFELKPGGRWSMVMHGPDGTDYPSANTFIDVVRSERVTFRHHQPPSHDFTMTMCFADTAGGTKLDWHMLFDSAEECSRLRTFIASANEQNFNRLDAFLRINPPN